jgi:hypothetical protein
MPVKHSDRFRPALEALEDRCLPGVAGPMPAHAAAAASSLQAAAGDGGELHLVPLGKTLPVDPVFNQPTERYAEGFAELTESSTGVRDASYTGIYTWLQLPTQWQVGPSHFFNFYIGLNLPTSGGLRQVEAGLSWSDHDQYDRMPKKVPFHWNVFVNEDGRQTNRRPQQPIDTVYQPRPEQLRFVDRTRRLSAPPPRA